MKKVAKRRILSVILLMVLMVSMINPVCYTTKTESATATSDNESSYIALADRLSGYDATNLFVNEKVSKEKNDVETVTASENDTSNEEPETADNSKVEEATPTIVETALEEVIYKYTSDVINIRSGPDTTYSIIKKVNVGTSLTISASESNGWYRINMLDGTYGYVCGNYLQDDAPLVDLGTYTISYYCPCAICCGHNLNLTASGTTPVEGITVATSSNIPFGTKLMIDGHVYTVEDRGGSYISSGARIDVFLSSHAECIQRGVHSASVYEVIE